METGFIVSGYLLQEEVGTALSLVPFPAGAYACMGLGSTVSFFFLKVCAWAVNGALDVDKNPESDIEEMLRDETRRSKPQHTLLPSLLSRHGVSSCFFLLISCFHPAVSLPVCLCGPPDL